MEQLGDRLGTLRSCHAFLSSELDAMEPDDNEDMTIPYYVEAVLNQFLQDLSLAGEDSQAPATQEWAPLPPDAMDVQQDVRRRRTASSSTCFPDNDLMQLAGVQVSSTVDRLRQRLDAQARDCPPEQYHNVMRVVTHEIARQTAERNARQRILLRLLADLLPRPNQDVNITPQGSLIAFDIFRDTINTIDGLHLRTFPMTPEFMDFDWAHDVLGPLGNHSLDIMSFLENADPIDDSNSSCAAIPEALQRSSLPPGPQHRGTEAGSPSDRERAQVLSTTSTDDQMGLPRSLPGFAELPPTAKVAPKSGPKNKGKGKGKSTETKKKGIKKSSDAPTKHPSSSRRNKPQGGVTLDAFMQK